MDLVEVRVRTSGSVIPRERRPTIASTANGHILQSKGEEHTVCVCVCVCVCVLLVFLPAW